MCAAPAGARFLISQTEVPSTKLVLRRVHDLCDTSTDTLDETRRAQIGGDDEIRASAGSRGTAIRRRTGAARDACN